MEGFVGEKGGSGHVARIFQYGNAEKKYDDEGNEGKDAPHPPEYSIHDEGLYKTLGDQGLGCLGQV